MHNQIKPYLFNPDELHYYLLMVSLDRCCDRSGNTAKNLFGRICVPYKIESLTLKLFNMIKELNESKTLLKHFFHVNLNANLMVKNVIQFKGRITTSFNVNKKPQ